MLHYEALRQLNHDRGEQLRQAADTHRLAMQARGQRQRRNRRLTLHATLELLQRSRRHARTSA